MIRYLTHEELILINRKTVAKHGGQYIEPSNFLNEGALVYLLEIVSSEMFGEPIYPKLSDKAGLYMYNIIANHIFSDGNKRTGLEAAILFLDLNRHRINKNIPKEIVYDFTIKVASGESNLDECQAWFALHIIKEYLQKP